MKGFMEDIIRHSFATASVDSKYENLNLNLLQTVSLIFSTVSNV